MTTISRETWVCERNYMRASIKADIYFVALDIIEKEKSAGGLLSSVRARAMEKMLERLMDNHLI